jgi:hypothetical protein
MDEHAILLLITVILNQQIKQSFNVIFSGVNTLQFAMMSRAFSSVRLIKTSTGLQRRLRSNG